MEVAPDVLRFMLRCLCLKEQLLFVWVWGGVRSVPHLLMLWSALPRTAPPRLQNTKIQNQYTFTKHQNVVALWPSIKIYIFIKFLYPQILSFWAVWCPNRAPGVSPSCLACIFTQIWYVQTLFSSIIMPIRGHFWFQKSEPKQWKFKMPARGQLRQPLTPCIFGPPICLVCFALYC